MQLGDASRCPQLTRGAIYSSGRALQLALYRAARVGEVEMTDAAGELTAGARALDRKKLAQNSKIILAAVCK